MEIVVTSFMNPFSFFCIPTNNANEVPFKTNLTENSVGKTRVQQADVSDFNHGQYVAVMWKDKWVRGIVTMETQFLIWLVDYGFFLRPTDKNVFIELPAEHKKYNTKVFEASLHGVYPLDRVLTLDCQMESQQTLNWSGGAKEKAQNLISSAIKTFFIPVAILSTQFNDIVLGDLYLQMPDKQIVNLVDELELWPKFLEKDPVTYISDLQLHYTSRRKHRASQVKPELPGFDVPIVSFKMTNVQYKAIIAEAAKYKRLLQFDDKLEEGSTVVTTANANEDADYKLSIEEIEKYSRMFITVHGREYNVLNVLLNKLRDLKICDKYKDYDGKGVGRASYHRCTILENDFLDYD